MAFHAFQGAANWPKIGAYKQGATDTTEQFYDKLC